MFGNCCQILRKGRRLEHDLGARATFNARASERAGRPAGWREANCCAANKAQLCGLRREAKGEKLGASKERRLRRLASLCPSRFSFSLGAHSSAPIISAAGASWLGRAEVEAPISMAASCRRPMIDRRRRRSAGRWRAAVLERGRNSLACNSNEQTTLADNHLRPLGRRAKWTRARLDQLHENATRKRPTSCGRRRDFCFVGPNSIIRAARVVCRHCNEIRLCCGRKWRANNHNSANSGAHHNEDVACRMLLSLGRVVCATRALVVSWEWPRTSGAQATPPRLQLEPRRRVAQETGPAGPPESGSGARGAAAELGGEEEEEFGKANLRSLKFMDSNVSNWPFIWR